MTTKPLPRRDAIQRMVEIVAPTRPFESKFDPDDEIIAASDWFAQRILTAIATYRDELAKDRVAFEAEVKHEYNKLRDTELARVVDNRVAAKLSRLEYTDEALTSAMELACETTDSWREVACAAMTVRAMAAQAADGWYWMDKGRSELLSVHANIADLAPQVPHDLEDYRPLDAEIPYRTRVSLIDSEREIEVARGVIDTPGSNFWGVIEHAPKWIARGDCLFYVCSGYGDLDFLERHKYKPI